MSYPPPTFPKIISSSMAFRPKFALQSSHVGNRSSFVGNRSSFVGNRSSFFGNRSSFLGNRSSFLGNAGTFSSLSVNFCCYIPITTQKFLGTPLATDFDDRTA